MIVHLFNSSSVSGPERLVLPALADFRGQFTIVNLREERIGRLRESDPLEVYARSFHLPYHAVKVRGRWDRMAIRDLRNLLERLQPNLVHAHVSKASVYLQRAARGPDRRYPIVSTHHGIHGLPDMKTRAYEFVYRRYFLKSFDRVLSVSTSDYNDMLASGVGRDKLRLHLNGADGRYMSFANRTKAAQSIRALWLPQEPQRDQFFLYGIVGRLSREKDQMRALRVLSFLNSLPCERDWRCLIFGAGAMEARLRRQTGQLNLERRVVWMGYRTTMPDEFSGLDLLLSFSKAEGLPVNLIEAGWAGTPVMSTKVGGVMDLIPDESYGNWIPAHETDEDSARRLQAAMTEEGQRRLLAQGNRFQERIMREFTQNRWIIRLAEIYAELNVGIRGFKETVNRRSETLCH